MPHEYRVHISIEALADIQSIFDYIERQSPQNAATTIERILDAVDTLDRFSTRHKVVGRSRRTGADVHSMVVRPYLVYYRVEERPRRVFIMTIKHGSQLQPVRFE